MNSALEKKTTWQDRLGDQWSAVRPTLIAFVVGAIVAPIFSNYMGWQVTRSKAERMSFDSGVHQQALICAVNARAEVADPAALGWSERRNLADKHAVMPGRSAAETGVASACSDILAKPA